jgi:hypothetical protein
MRGLFSWDQGVLGEVQEGDVEQPADGDAREEKGGAWLPMIRGSQAQER